VSNVRREGVVVVVPRGEQFLVIRRAPGILAGGAWCFVGGGIDAGESQVAAAIREFREEMGADIVPRSRLWEFKNEAGTLLLHWWSAALAEDETAFTPNAAEVSEFAWLRAEQILALPNLLASNATFVRLVQAGAITIDV
jgi:8-oxo-dGTP pyrophosphatase MutT (NUDIX family)